MKNFKLNAYASVSLFYKLANLWNSWKKNIYMYIYIEQKEKDTLIFWEF